MKAFFLFLLTGLLCIGCTPPDHQPVALLEQKLEATPASSAAFDSLLQEVRTLPPPQRIALLLSPSLCHLDDWETVAKQEPLLLELLPLASKRERHQLLLRLVELYAQQGNYRFIPNARSKGLRWCEELESNYKLSQRERWEVLKVKALMLDQAGQQNLYMPIWFELLEEHRREGETARVVEDLTAIATHLANLGDEEKSLITYQEAYQLAVNNGFTEQRNRNLIEIINRTSRLGRYEELLTYFRQVGVDSLASILPSAYSMLATCYVQLDKPDSARVYFQKQMQALPNPEQDGTLYLIDIARTFVDESHEDSAASYLQKAMTALNEEAAHTRKKNIKTTLPGTLLEAYPAFATLLQHNGKTQQAGEAFALVEPLMRKSVKGLPLFERQIDALTHYADYCQATRQYEKGFELLTRRDSLRQLHIKLKAERTDINLAERFKMQELTYTIDLQKAQLAYSHRTLVTIGCAAFILLCSLVPLIYLYRQHRRQLALLSDREQEIEQLRSAADLTPAPDAPQVATENPLNPIEELFRVAQQKVVAEKLFLNKELSLDQLAHELDTNRSYLSSCINTCSGGNFNQWINSYRIDYVLERIHTAPNLLALAAEAGFLSSDSFYRHFKRCTQMTTTQYLKASL